MINDLDPYLINFYRDLKKNGCKTVNTCKIPRSKKGFENLDENTACGFFAKNKSSYGGNMNVFGYIKKPQNNINFKKQCSDIQNMLKNTDIYNQDFEKVLRKHNKKDTFAYLDPPYSNHQQENDLYRYSSNVSPQHVCNTLKKFKGKFLLSYDNSNDVRNACDDFNIEKINHTYSLQNKKQKKIKELLIRNY